MVLNYHPMLDKMIIEEMFMGKQVLSHDRRITFSKIYLFQIICLDLLYIAIRVNKSKSYSKLTDFVISLWYVVWKILIYIYILTDISLIIYISLNTGK